eukprot:CAMPEP_0117889228 /NCGR_PEP_ID=MMETSP0950-20121206/22474_1 /TAXON_ID=44440 /ORGANISM="Chattonella subsalsa, Strain CCMP2191" /LENGTH=137 /DNA_ID=CAMNT_0005747993 /DNA_START=423 /DNA_END=836 /DNA_ORIENTATION=+
MPKYLVPSKHGISPVQMGKAVSAFEPSAPLDYPVLEMGQKQQQKSEEPHFQEQSACPNDLASKPLLSPPQILSKGTQSILGQVGGTNASELLTKRIKLHPKCSGPVQEMPEKAVGCREGNHCIGNACGPQIATQGTE